MVKSFFHIVKILLCALAIIAPWTNMQAKNFVVVIDAGHGGHDTGAPGMSSNEKDITLRTALAVGKLIEQNCSDVNVIYTRQSDVFIPLHRRTEIANEAKANLFISIHANSVPKGASSPMGFEIYSQGLARSTENLNVAKRENSVVLYESDYKTRYQGFDPNSPESDIIFEVMQDKYMKESVHFASIVQSQMRYSQRRDRGVHQLDLCVLRTCAMPSVLIELGFISSPAEESFMNSDEGVRILSQDIYRAFTIYKRENDMRTSGRSMTTVPDAVRPSQDNDAKNDPSAQDSEEKQNDKADKNTGDKVDRSQTDKVDNNKTDNNKVYRSKRDRKKVDSEKKDSDATALKAPVKKETARTQQDSTRTLFKIQLLASRSQISKGDKQLKDIDNVECVQEDGYYKYFCGASEDYNSVYRKRKDLESRFNGAFIVAYRNGVKTDVVEAIRQFKRNRSNRQNN
jgi:N-acetylmuramoyl-L-alanine amidase